MIVLRCTHAGCPSFNSQLAKFYFYENVKMKHIVNDEMVELVDDPEYDEFPETEDTFFCVECGNVAKEVEDGR